MEQFETVRREFDSALELLELFSDWHGISMAGKGDAFTVTNEISGYCCDIGYYSDEYDGYSLGDVYWYVMNYVHSNVHYSLVFFPDEKGNPDKEFGVHVGIHDNDGGERSSRTFTIVPV